jgi:hypothetical protein
MDIAIVDWMAAGDRRRYSPEELSQAPSRSALG